MRRAEAAIIVFLACWAVVAFLPVWRTVYLGGMSAFGWWMAGLMVVGPSLTLLVFRSGKKQADTSHSERGGEE